MINVKQLRLPWRIFFGSAHKFSFWLEILKLPSMTVLFPDPMIAILGLSNSHESLSPEVWLSVQYDMIVAKKVILLWWKKNSKLLFSA